MPTLKDLSRHLGLSVTQVSRALNGHSDVSEATRLRVEKAAKKLKYMPNVAARRLVSGRSGMVGFVERSYPGIARDTILLETVTGLSRCFSERDMQFVLHLSPHTDSKDMVAVYERLALGGGLDGFVLTNPRRDDARIRGLQDLGVPFVVHGRGELDATYPFVDIDNLGVGRMLTDHLIARGHHRIALINAEETYAFSAFRAQGYREALAAAGLPHLPRLVRTGRMTDALGMIATAQMFAGREPKPTAIICSNILIAKGVFSALEALGLSVPQDVSVVAHDDQVAELHPEGFYPPLTVTRSALSLSWTPLAEALVGAVEGAATETLQTFLPLEFREGGSVGPAPD
jgi:LacI family transcriptional regulator